MDFFLTPFYSMAKTDHFFGFFLFLFSFYGKQIVVGLFFHQFSCLILLFVLFLFVVPCEFFFIASIMFYSFLYLFVISFLRSFFFLLREKRVLSFVFHHHYLPYCSILLYFYLWLSVCRVSLLWVFIFTIIVCFIDSL